MPVIITLKDIEETINNLNYRSETTLKSKLIYAIRNFYQDENSIEKLKSIDTEELVKSIWGTGNNPESIKNKRKNFSSIKSSVNSDLKKLYQEGKNPQGIIIGHSNIFDISDEAKNKALASIADIFREKGIDAQSRITEILAALGDILTGSISSSNAEEAREEIDRLKNLIVSLSGKLGLPIPVDGAPDKTGTRKDIDEKTGDGTGIKIIAEDAGKSKGIEEGTSEGARAKALSGITEILKDKKIDAANKMNKIMEAVQGILSDAISLAGPDLNSREAEQIRNFFGNLAETSGTMFPNGSAVEESGEESVGIEIIEEIEEPIIEEASDIGEESIDAEPVAEESIIVEEIEISGEEEYTTDEGMEELQSDKNADTEAIAGEMTADEAVEIVEEISGNELAFAADALVVEDEALTGPEKAEEEQAEQPDGTTPDKLDYEEIIETDNPIAPPLTALTEKPITVELTPEEEIVAENTTAEAVEIFPEDYATAETTIEDNPEELEELEITEEAVVDELEEIIEEQIADKEESPAGQGKTAGEVIEGDLRSKAEILTELAEAAKALEKIGPELSNNIYSEKEIREKAKLLSEEFDRYLTIREKFYNQHILIKGVNYKVGGTNRGENEFPEQTVNLREFYIGKFPVTNAIFEIFVEKTGYITTAEKYGFGMVYIPRMQRVKNTLTGAESFVWNNQLQHKKIPGACWYHPSGPASTLYIKRTHPVVQVSLEDACAFAAWTGKRIPTEREWEAAARTSRGHLYPWGNIWQEDACNLEKSLLGDTAPVDKYLEYVNEYEVADTLGNVLEWTLDPWRECEPDEENYVVKGASWISDSEVGLTDRQPVYKNAGSNILGFRCIAI